MVKLWNVKATLDNCRDNISPKKEKMIESQKKEIDEYVGNIMNLRKELKDSCATSKKEVDGLKVQLESEIENVVASEAIIQDLRTKIFLSETKCEELNDILSCSEKENSTLL